MSTERFIIIATLAEERAHAVKVGRYLRGAISEARLAGFDPDTSDGRVFCAVYVASLPPRLEVDNLGIVTNIRSR